ncbi:AtpZ/AtpI family protein [Gelidibacter sp. F63206]|uniref:AtpZ/AtpI family protein n=1 Tax=Gelidibacter sp. F63206 TaxID=2926425 RepID=UPI001FF41147|nr:AtpZ/AtpI family protein [Gelidibacter sp. F63206]MCK0114474.1 AtpZ/AtpI family protein [Gelidibacter sp. F63206]
MSNQPKRDNPLNSYAKYSSIAIQMFAIIGIGSFIGVKIDDHYGNENNLWTIILSLTSTIVAVVFVIRRIIANSKDEN